MNNLSRCLRILNTRPTHQNRSLSQMIQEQGYISVELPAIQIESFHDSDQSIDLSTIQHIIFTSANAIKYYFATHHCLPAHLIVTAIGQASASMLEQQGVTVHHVPSIENSEYLLQMPHLQAVRQQTVLLIKGKGGRGLITQTLRERAATVIELDLYQRTLPKIDRSYLDFLWHQNVVDIILFTSQEAMYNLFKLFGEEARSWLCSKPCLVISERLAETAHALGIQTVIVDSLKNGLTPYKRMNV